MHWYILSNCEEVDPYIEEHKQILRTEDTRRLEERHKEQFPKWFLDRMISLRKGEESIERLYCLARGPDPRARHYSGCIVNGVRFHTISRDKNLKTQNSGVVVEGNHDTDSIDFFGVLNDIIELEYISNNRVVLFKCDWYDLDKRKKGMVKEGRLTSIKTTRFWYKDDPYVLALQAQQVFYLSDLKLGAEWRVVQKFKHRHLYDYAEKEELHDIGDVAPVENGVCQDSEPEDDYHEIQMTEADEVSLYRSNVAAEIVSVTVDSSQDMERDTSKDYEELDEIEEEELVEISDEDNTNDPLQSDSDEDFF